MMMGCLNFGRSLDETQLTYSCIYLDIKDGSSINGLKKSFFKKVQQRYSHLVVVIINTSISNYS